MRIKIKKKYLIALSCIIILLVLSIYPFTKVYNARKFNQELCNIIKPGMSLEIVSKLIVDKDLAHTVEWTENDEEGVFRYTIWKNMYDSMLWNDTDYFRNFCIVEFENNVVKRTFMEELK